MRDSGRHRWPATEPESRMGPVSRAQHNRVRIWRSQGNRQEGERERTEPGKEA